MSLLILTGPNIISDCGNSVVIRQTIRQTLPIQASLTKVNHCANPMIWMIFQAHIANSSIVCGWIHVGGFGKVRVNCFPKATATWHSRESSPRSPDQDSNALTTLPRVLVTVGFLLVGGRLFMSTADDYDKTHDINSNYGYSFFVMSVACGLSGIAVILMSAPLCNKCSQKKERTSTYNTAISAAANLRARAQVAGSSSGRTTRASTTNTATSTTTTTAAAATTNNVATMVISTTSSGATAISSSPSSSSSSSRATATANTIISLQGVEMAKPPSYSKQCPDYEDLFERFAAITNQFGSNINSIPYYNTGYTEPSADDQDSRYRSSSSGIYTARVDPCPDLPPFGHHEDTSNLPSPLRPEPPSLLPLYTDMVTYTVPQPRYSDTFAYSTPQPQRLPSEPPPSYERAMALDYDRSSYPSQMDRDQPRSLSPARLSESEDENEYHC
ncbi:hypothetical protein ElyMa_002372700 [Elysia marginata]|uniref:Uncharacterized protein n=1 Tax=Elysia marginata TaxID=1093978 RepID=A0AAV4GBL8_9GAST|nr:hypothetical protein ElyMa_002372700 [Elysia marginata]